MDSNAEANWHNNSLIFLRNAYPNGIPENDLNFVIRIFYGRMSQRSLATLLGLFSNKSYMDYYNLVLGVGELESLGKLRLNHSEVVRVLEYLKRHGFDEWEKEYPIL